MTTSITTGTKVRYCVRLGDVVTDKGIGTIRLIRRHSPDLDHPYQGYLYFQVESAHTGEHIDCYEKELTVMSEKEYFMELLKGNDDEES